MTWTHRPGIGPYSIRNVTCHWCSQVSDDCPLPSVHCNSCPIDPGTRPWQQGASWSQSYFLQRFKSISTQDLMSNIPEAEKVHLFLKFDPSDPWQQVMDDHDEWNPDIQKSSTKILSEWSKNRVGSIATSDNNLLSETTVYPGRSLTTLKDPICVTYHGINPIPQGRYSDRSNLHPASSTNV